MNQTVSRLIVLFIVLFFLPIEAFLQDSLGFDLRYEINKVYPSLSINRKSLNDVQTIIDINPHYQPAWIKTYSSVEVKAVINGKSIIATSNNDTFTEEQLDIMRESDYGSDIAIKILYMPENNLTHNDLQEFSFTYDIDPENNAQFKGGKDLMNQYLKSSTLDLIAPSKFKEHNLTAVKFTIDEDGHIIDPEVIQSSNYPEVDKILLEAICNMPNWKPAEYGDGTMVKEDYVMSIGDHKSCTLNLLNVRRL